MPVFEVGGQRVVESGSFVIPNGQDRAVVTFAGVNLQFVIDPTREAATFGVSTQSPTDFTVEVGSHTSTVKGFWHGKLESLGATYHVAVISHATANAASTSHAFTYTVVLA